MLTIGRLAKQARMSTDSIRFYEREGLIEPTTKTDAGYRLYREEAAQRLSAIKHAQRCGFSLAEIRALLNARSPEGAAAQDLYRVAVEKRAQIEETMTALRIMSDALATVIAMNSEDSRPARLDAMDQSLFLVALDSRMANQQALRDGERM